MTIRRFLHVVDVAVGPLYLLLTLAALGSLFSPTLSSVAAYGKGRSLFSSAASDNFFSRNVFLVPKRYFLHFYCFGLATLAALQSQTVNTSWTVALLAVHISRRLYECLFVHRWNEVSKMHVVGYAVGTLHYVLLPFVLVQCRFTDEHRSSLRQFAFVAAIALNLWAQFQQHRHHQLLADLRSSNHSVDKKDIPYKLPSGGWFDRVASRHYLAEIFIYLSFFALVQLQVTTCTRYPTATADEPFLELPELLRTMRRGRHFFLLVWVVTNLTITSLRTHQYYVRNITGFDQTRTKALVPYLL